MISPNQKNNRLQTVTAHLSAKTAQAKGLRFAAPHELVVMYGKADGLMEKNFGFAVGESMSGDATTVYKALIESKAGRSFVEKLQLLGFDMASFHMTVKSKGHGLNITAEAPPEITEHEARVCWSTCPENLSKKTEMVTFRFGALSSEEQALIVGAFTKAQAGEVSLLDLLIECGFDLKTLNFQIKKFQIQSIK
jgi:hypothetical protein